MGLIKYNGDFWLAKGWSEFAQHYSLEIGQTLIIRYTGCSRFDVVIVGYNKLEIDYPITSSARFSKPVNDDGDDKEVSSVPCVRTEEKPVPPFLCTQIGMKRYLGDTQTRHGSHEMKPENPMSMGDYLRSCKSKEMKWNSMPPFSCAQKRMKINLEDAHPRCGSHEMKPNNPSIGDFLHSGKSKGMQVESRSRELQVHGTKQHSLNRAEKAKALSRAKDTWFLNGTSI